MAPRKKKEPSFHKTMQMGLGEAIQRMMLLSDKLKRTIATEVEREEHKLIVTALNETKLDLGFDCDMDGVPDSIEIFAQSAETACCRILPTDTSRRAKAPATSRRKAPPKKRTKTTTRRKGK